MQLDSLNRLRIAFLALGAMLLVPLAWLIHSVDERVETQRRLRHQVVAERIFDELERELTRVLDEESARPSLSFDAELPNTKWEPYVVGYFKTNADARDILSAEDLDPSRRKRIAWALAQPNVLTSPESPGQQPGIAIPPSANASNEAPKPASAPAKLRSGSSLDVLRQLNRAKDQRQEQQYGNNQLPDSNR